MNQVKDWLIEFFKTRSRADWLLSISTLGLIIGLLISAKAWSADRTFPLSPIITGLEISPSAHEALFLTVLVTMVGSLFRFRLRKYLLNFALVALLILVLTDITRLQPWILHYGAILFLFSYFVPKKYLSSTILLDASRIIIGGIYFWSGAQKLNINFFTEVFPWFTEHLWMPFGEKGTYVAVSVALFVPFIEMIFALGLFTKRWRKFSMIASSMMLLVVLSSIGPLGHNWNSSVWPWNIAIFAMVITLFLGSNFTTKEFILRVKGSFLCWIVIFIFWIMPAGNWVGLTDHYLSWSLYSGKVPEAAIIGNQEFLETLSPASKDGELRFIGWTMQELNLVPYPETRVFVDVFETLCNKNSAQPMTLLIENNSPFASNFNQQRSYKCNEPD